MSLKEIVYKAVKNFNEAKREEYLNIFDENCIIHGFPHGFEGKAGLEQFYNLLWQAFPDLKISIEDMIEEDDKVTVRFIATGTHKGEFLGVKPTNKHVTFDAITILKFANDKVIERWQCTNEVAMLRQLGFI